MVVHGNRLMWEGFPLGLEVAMVCVALISLWREVQDLLGQAHTREAHGREEQLGFTDPGITLRKQQEQDGD